jgi:hypothetical protein
MVADKGVAVIFDFVVLGSLCCKPVGIRKMVHTFTFHI